MKESSKKIRFRWLIYPRFQYRLIAVQSGAMVAVCGLVLLTTHSAFHSLRESGLKAGLSTNHAYFKFLDAQAWLIYQRVVAGLIVGAVGTAFVSLWLSNRVAGPIVRMRGYFKSLGQSDQSSALPLKFRKGDFFDELPEEVNGALQRLQRTKNKSSENGEKQDRGAA